MTKRERAEFKEEEYRKCIEKVIRDIDEEKGIKDAKQIEVEVVHADTKLRDHGVVYEDIRRAGDPIARTRPGTQALNICVLLEHSVKPSQTQRRCLGHAHTRDRRSIRHGGSENQGVFRLSIVRDLQLHVLHRTDPAHNQLHRRSRCVSKSIRVETSGADPDSSHRAHHPVTP